MNLVAELQEYKELLEKQLKVTVDDAPITLSYSGQHAWVMGVKSTALYALEMLPDVETVGLGVYTGTGSDYLDCVLGVGGFEQYGPVNGDMKNEL